MPTVRSMLRFGPHRAALREALTHQLSQVRGLSRGLDLGCGDGPYRELLAASCGQVVSYDIRPQPGVRVVGSAMSLPFRASVFDLVLSTQVLEHVSEPAEVIGEIARVLRPTGKVILTVPQMVALHEAPHDYFRYTEHGIAHLLRKHGFADIHIQPLGGFWAMIAQQLEFRLLWDRAPRWGILRRLQLALGRLALAGVAALDGRRPETRYALNLVATARRSS